MQKRRKSTKQVNELVETRQAVGSKTYQTTEHFVNLYRLDLDLWTLDLHTSNNKGKAGMASRYSRNFLDDISPHLNLANGFKTPS